MRARIQSDARAAWTLIASGGRRSRHGGKIVLRGEDEFLLKLALQQEHVHGSLEENRPHGKIPDVFDIESRQARNDYRRENEDEQADRGADQRRPGIADSLKDTRRGKDDPHREK